MLYEGENEKKVTAAVFAGPGAQELRCGAGEPIELEIRVQNRGDRPVHHISISHMLRDPLVYVPDTLRAEKGEAALLFRLLRWRIAVLAPGETGAVRLYVQAQGVKECIFIGATYTYQDGEMHGPYEASGAVVRM